MRNQEQIDRYLERMIQDAEREMDRVFAQRMQAINNRVAGLYRGMEEGRTPSRSNVTEYMRFMREVDLIEQELSADYQWVLERTQALLEDTYISGYLQRMYYGEYQAQAAVLQTAPTLAVILASVENPIEYLKLPSLMEKHRASIIEAVRSEITQGLMAGEDYSRMAKRIEEAVGFSDVKAKRVARTEAGRVQVQSALDTFDEMQEQTTLEWVKTWSSALDQRVRPAHRVLDGQEADEEGYFHYQGLRAKGPHKWNEPSMDINCRCSVHMLPADYEIEERRAIEDGQSVIRGNINYRQWFEERIGQNFAEWYQETTGRELKD